MTKIKQVLTIAVFFLLLACGGILTLLLPQTAVSKTERRVLKQITSFAQQKITAQSSGKEYGLSDYFSDLETALCDQFPLRDALRRTGAVTNRYLLGMRDNQGYYLAEGSFSKMDGTLHRETLKNDIVQFNAIQTQYFETQQKVYFALVPDKNYFLAQNNGYLHYDYDEMQRVISEKLSPEITQIPLFDLLGAKDYYRTDPHWTQPKILPVADRLLEQMGSGYRAADGDYVQKDLPDFAGTYYGQAALSLQKETLSYLENETICGATVENLTTGARGNVYDPAKINGTDGYDVFLDGAQAMLKIQNPENPTGKQLVVFRDSFGSSLIPLLIPAYREILVLDIRYVSPGVVGQFMSFDKDCDVLYLYSTSVLNSPGAFMR